MGQARAVIRIGAVVLALVAPFFFSVGITAFLAVLGAVATPAVPLAVGLILDALYWIPGSSLPTATITGALASLGALFVHRYVKASIMYE